MTLKVTTKSGNSYTIHRLREITEDTLKLYSPLKDLPLWKEYPIDWSCIKEAEVTPGKRYINRELKEKT